MGTNLVEQRAGFLEAVVPDEPRDDEQRTLFGHVDAIAPVGEHPPKFGQPFFAQEVRVERSALGAGRDVRESGEEFALVRLKRTAGE